MTIFFGLCQKDEFWKPFVRCRIFVEFFLLEIMQSFLSSILLSMEYEDAAFACVCRVSHTAHVRGVGHTGSREHAVGERKTTATAVTGPVHDLALTPSHQLGFCRAKWKGWKKWLIRRTFPALGSHRFLILVVWFWKSWLVVTAHVRGVCSFSFLGLSETTRKPFET